MYSKRPNLHPVIDESIIDTAKNGVLIKYSQYIICRSFFLMCIVIKTGSTGFGYCNGASQGAYKAV